MMNVWSLKRFSSTTGSSITSSSNSIGYFAYSINSKIIVFDINSMIDGSNGNIMLKSNTFNRVVIDIQGETKNIRPWKDFSANKSQDYITLEPFCKFWVKSVFVNDLQWGPYTQSRWSILFSSLNNGVVHIWLVPNIDSYSLPNYSPIPCFELLDLVYNSLTTETDSKLVEFDWDTMKAVKGNISQNLCTDLMLNTDTPIAYSCVLSVQKSEISFKNNGFALFSACWNEFFVVYAIDICENPEESCKTTINKILTSEQKYLFESFPITPKVNCRPLILTRIPDKKLDEIVTSCLITEFWSSGKELLFEIYTGSSEGKIQIFKFSILEDSRDIKCLGHNLINKSCPSVPITQLSYKPVSNISNGKEHILLASKGTNIFFGKVGVEGMNCEILKPTIHNIKFSHQMPIKTAKYMEDIIYNEKIFDTAFLTVDQSGLGILHIVDLEKKTFNSVQVLTMSKLNDAPSMFPNLDQSSNNSSNDLESSNQNLNKSFSLESLQNVPSSIKSIKNSNNDFRLISFENPLVPGQFYNFKKKSLHNFSIAVTNSAALNTIRLIIVFNNFSPMDHICNRISNHFIHTESLINNYSDFEDEKCLYNLSKAVSQAFTLNDIRLILAGPLTMNKIPLLEEIDEKPPKGHEDLIQPKEVSGSNSNGSLNEDTNKKMSSFLNLKLGEKLRLKVKDEESCKDESSDEVLNVFFSIFYEIIPLELIKDAISYNLIEDEFPQDITSFFNIYKPIFSNLILLIFCYIIEIEPFIPKSLEYVVGCKDKNNSFETLVKTLNQAVPLSELPNKELEKSNLSKESMLSLLFKIIYLVRILNSLRCLVVLLYSRSNETVDPSVIKREEQMSIYLVKLQYYIQLQITQVYHVEFLGLQPNLSVTAGLKYIWSCVKESKPIYLSQIALSDKGLGEYFQDLIDNSCCLISEPPYNLYQCLNKHQEFMDSKTFDAGSSNSNSNSNFKDGCVSSVPICPITFLPVNVFAMHKHLSCNFCGKVIFIPTEMINQTCIQSGKDLSSSISIFEKISLRGGYYTCQFCLNVTELLDI
ncbi:uncharacterized protein cubi_03176 [Cryptosporidium ubiquitum]|uniref:Uncharacterized protein n=1 Tax=Cryptosporidium ubiquitum TaxID=857276 RepID=A0A1J4MLU0_9CRYT|nr:uncharacterized protein cubi_03176 [Cryptosporidium ubiquitum]OII75160.1 hypothetical protein cubi_03176 [Cryptosporidium ubiquitum]